MSLKISAMTPAASAAATDLLEISRPSGPTTLSVTIAQVLKAAADGTGAAPTIRFASEATGLFLNAAGDLGISVGGTMRVDVSTTALTSTIPVVVPAGSAGATSINFGTAGTGLYGSSTQINAAISGNVIHATTSSGVVFTSGLRIESTTNGVVILGGQQTTAANGPIAVQNQQVFTGGACTAQTGVRIIAGVNQTSTASFAALKFELGTVVAGTGAPVFGSGGGFFIDAQTNSTSVFQVTSAGAVRAGGGTLSAPDFSFVGNTNSGFYNNSGQIRWSVGGVFVGTLSASGIIFNGDTFGLSQASAGNTTSIGGSVTSQAKTSVQFGNGGNTMSGAAGIAQINTKIATTLNQTSTASFTALNITTTETAVGSGAQSIIDAYAGAAGTTQVFNVSNTGRVYAGDGTGPLPAMSFLSLTTMGWYKYDANNMGLAIGGAGRVAFSQGGITALTAHQQYFVAGNVTTTATQATRLTNNATFTGGAGISQGGVLIDSTINQTSTAAFTSLDIVGRETALGSGAQYAINVKAGAAGTTQVFSVSNKGGLSQTFVSPSTLASGTTNDYTGTAGYSFARITANASNSTLSGISATNVPDGFQLCIINISASATLTIQNNGAGSSAANRVLTISGADVVLAAKAVIYLVYDLTSATWRQV